MNLNCLIRGEYNTNDWTSIPHGFATNSPIDSRRTSLLRLANSLWGSRWIRGGEVYEFAVADDTITCHVSMAVTHGLLLFIADALINLSISMITKPMQ